MKNIRTESIKIEGKHVLVVNPSGKGTIVCSGTATNVCLFREGTA